MTQTEAVVAQFNELQNGEKRQVTVGETAVLLIRHDNQVYALGAYCTHNQAPLVQGVIHDDHIVCPWHNAYFNITTGDQQEPPGLDSLPQYSLRIEDNQVIVTVPDSAAGKRTPDMVQYDPAIDPRTFVILGAGAAGTHATETLRVVGYQGRIVMVTRDDKLPYDRTTLSKNYFTGKATKEKILLRSPAFYEQHHIEVQLNQTVQNVNVNTKTITFQNGETLIYDSLLIATGGQPRQLEVPGADLQNVFTLRSFADCERILKSAQNASQAVVVGSSFIGMEIASGLTQKGVKVTVVSPASLPFEKTLGAELGQLFQQVHEEKGVTFQMGRKVTQLEGAGAVQTVVLDNGGSSAAQSVRLPADLVVVGIGVQPVTDFITGIDLHPKDQSVPVDEYLCAAEGVYAAGDIARYPDWRTSDSMRVEHWRIAAQHGRIAAYNMAGKPTKFRGVPVFWSMQFQFPIRYVGHATEWDELIVDGDLNQREFIAFYVKDNQVLAAASSKRDTETAAIAELLRLNQMPTPDELRQGQFKLIYPALLSN
ncbi:NAD(FAD)-dependent dehydrogenase [Phormidesmis priestleyi ULC007]|uniref:NAD(FAD)-dependent dehydrogenase n=1 Tax=Phormidesmis priestleyi ULC007 TaxID=1920490 RepID=A0A2T1DI49_9CYAN|nr:FAD-dependent oxidoreductase [Phormidesmis priestleyi]PSB20168.1 NAD(FAD)-dependent dehydrogenase [Phormidesmis priestleyi ULC007]PZO49098.1 MAG: NAD(FAD)-dependent dehydrogenase [Phormidesmis priestleyi]